jgi:hypothetical protein
MLRVGINTVPDELHDTQDGLRGFRDPVDVVLRDLYRERFHR